MAKTARQRIEDACKKLGLEIFELTYDRSITYVGGGWEIRVKHPDYDDEIFTDHSSDVLIDEMEETYFQ